MENMAFFKVFYTFIRELYDTENQILKSLPLMIQESSHKELIEGLTEHLEETKTQVDRLKRVFKLLGEEPRGKHCKGISGILEEGKEILEKQSFTRSVKDCFIIISAQKIEHYEIACYGSLISLVEHIQSAWGDNAKFKEMYQLFKESLKEEEKADKKLTKIAEGKFFMTGVNEEIEKDLKIHK